MVCQVLALINASNNSCSPAIIDYTEFYNTALDHTDLMKVWHILTLEMNFLMSSGPWLSIILILWSYLKKLNVAVKEQLQNLPEFVKKKVFVRYVSFV